MNITQATTEGDAQANMIVDRDEDYNTRYGSYQGYLMAHERVKRIPRHAADLNLASMVTEAQVKTVDQAVDYLAGRFLRVPLAGDDRAALVEFLLGKLGTSDVAQSDMLEQALRQLLYLVLSIPEYQLG